MILNIIALKLILILHKDVMKLNAQGKLMPQYKKIILIRLQKLLFGPEVPTMEQNYYLIIVIKISQLKKQKKHSLIHIH